MTFSEAKKIRSDFNNNPCPTEEDEFLFTEAMTWLIQRDQERRGRGETGNPYYACELGAFYYGKRNFDLALKYYEIADRNGMCRDACAGLGYIWYYGRTGKRDFEKAFRYYSRAMEQGDLQCEYKIADMYKNGYYVRKDYEKYKSMIRNLYLKTCEGQQWGCVTPYVEIYTRLAGICREEGDPERAVRLLRRAKQQLIERISHNPFFGNLSIMKGIEEELRSLDAVDEDTADLYDIYAFSGEACRFFFTYFGDRQEAEIISEDGNMVIRFNEQWFRTADDFFAGARIDGQLLTALYYELDEFEMYLDAE